MNENLVQEMVNLKLSQDTNQFQEAVDKQETNQSYISKFCSSEDEDCKMTHETEVYESMKLIGYDGPLLNLKEYKKALEGGPKNLKYTELISFLVNELKVVSSIDEVVNSITSPDDSATFIMEVSSLLNELGCPYKFLTQGHVSERLDTIPHRLLLIDYLVSQVMAARIIRQSEPGKQIELKLKETSQAADLGKIMAIVGLTKPPANITVLNLMQKLNQSVDSLVKKAPQLVGKALFNESLSPGEWDDVNKILKEIHEDYSIRREMLLKRLDCTIQSFQWSGKTKGKEEALNKAFFEKRKLLKIEPQVDISDLIAAREELAIIVKTSNATVRKNTKSSVNTVIIGQVPDRGGRTSEQAPPPPEMPSWQQQRSTGPGGGFKRGAGNFARGGGGQQQRGRNNYSQGQQSFDSAGTYGQESRGNYHGQESRGNYHGQESRGNYHQDSRATGGNYDQYSKGQGTKFANSNTGDRKNYTDRADYSQSNSGNYGNSNYRQDNYDSAGSYGGGYTQEPKRARTYDQFQQNNTTYADQYVQESQQNQQFQPRGEYRNRGGPSGRSNYNRGGYR